MSLTLNNSWKGLQTIYPNRFKYQREVSYSPAAVVIYLAVIALFLCSVACAEAKCWKKRKRKITGDKCRDIGTEDLGTGMTDFRA
jgi:hypothetical protein